jgi:hypothetical protein
MKHKIDWENITEKEAQEVLDLMQSRFNLVFKSTFDSKWHDVFQIKTMGDYDDNFHAYILNKK